MGYGTLALGFNALRALKPRANVSWAGVRQPNFDIKDKQKRNGVT